jgi:hypothetical protein
VEYALSSSYCYDTADRHVSTTKGGTTITYWRDPTDRIVGRAVGATWEEWPEAELSARVQACPEARGPRRSPRG